MKYLSETKIGGYSFIPFHSLVSVIMADHQGLRWTVESRILGRPLRINTMLQAKWSDLSKVELHGVGDNMRLKLIPCSSEHFRQSIRGFTAPIKIKTDTDGSVYMLNGERALRLYELCSTHVATTQSP